MSSPIGWNLWKASKNYSENNLCCISYVDDCVHWYTYKELGNCFVDILGKRFHANLLGYAHWLMRIRISQTTDFLIPVDKARYATAVVSQHLDTSTIQENYKYHKITLPYHMEIHQRRCLHQWITSGRTL